jgi:DNA repair/transcription protein MET18/MMS19
MKAESLIGVTTLVTGEKDPRNLMLIFSMLKVLMIEWDISNHAQTLFDSVYAYFPITFRPPPNDPYGITAQDLKDRLRECLSSTGELAPYTFPNMLDRLDSTSVAVKTDCLRCLASCALNYDSATLSQHSTTLWDAIKFEILQAQEPELAEEALRVLKNIAIGLTRSPKSAQNSIHSPLLQYLKPVNKECLEHLQEPAARQAKASGDILKAVSSASIPAFEIVMKAMGPSLLDIYQSARGIVHQRAVLEIANQLFESSIEVYGAWASPSQKNPEGCQNIISEFKDNFVTLYSQALMGTVKEEVSFRLTAANGLLLVSKMHSVLSDDELGLFVQYFDDIVLNEEVHGRDELKKKAMSVLAEISQFKPVSISNITFPAFMARLPDSELEASTTDYQSVLEGLAEISLEKELSATLMRRLFNKLDILFSSGDNGPFPYTRAILGTVFYVLKRSATSSDVSLDLNFDRIVVGLSRKVSEATSGALVNETVLDLLGRVMNLVVRHSATKHIQYASENVYTLFHPAAQDLVTVTPEREIRLVLSTWLLASLPRNVQGSLFTRDQISQRVAHLLDLATTSSTAAVQQSCLSQVGLYANKHAAIGDLVLFEDIIEQRLFGLRTSRDTSALMTLDVRILFALSKSLILRLAPKSNDYLTNLINLLDTNTYPQEVSRTVAMGFSTILAHDDILSADNAAQIRKLAPQRVFQTLTPLISEKFKASQSAVEKENYLVALSGVLSSVPSEIVMPELPTLLPLLLQSLDISDQAVKIATLETLAVVISSNPAALVESGHLSSLTKRLLAVSAEPKSQSSKSSTTKTPASPLIQQENLPKARRLATRCITLMPRYIVASGTQPNPLLGLKRDVLHGLMKILDDSKRDVRKEAVDARAAWLRNVDDVDDDD